jgi:tRNA (mo5U34)-methyltransferase
MSGTQLSRNEIRARIQSLGPWFHNIELGGIATAPEHFLGDYPQNKWRQFSHALPSDLSGASVLDIGCNGGFYAIEMKRRGARRVLGIDFDQDYLDQAEFAAKVNDLDIEFRQLSVYEVGRLEEQFDIVLFLGVFYHLRHPLLALDLIRAHVVKDLFVFQSMQRGDPTVEPVAQDYGFFEKAPFDAPGYPKLHFVEHAFAGDPTNWWVPNRAGVEALLRASGFAIVSHPEEEVYVCRADAIPPTGLAIPQCEDFTG